MTRGIRKAGGNKDPDLPDISPKQTVFTNIHKMVSIWEIQNYL